jgi:hypothetical protein
MKPFQNLIENPVKTFKELIENIKMETKTSKSNVQNDSNVESRAVLFKILLVTPN